MVTSRATDENLTDDQGPRTSEIMASPRQQLAQSLDKPTPANSAPATTAAPDDGASDATAGGGVSSNGASARGNEDAPANGGRAAADATVVDGIPALPADTIGEPRSSPPTDLDADQATGSKAAAQPQAGDSPVLSFGSPATAPAKPAVEDPTIAYPAESAAKPGGDDPAAPLSSRSASSRSASSGTVPASGSVPGAGSAAAAGSRPAPADPSSVSPAAFAWGMPDPPPDSRSSPARTFLRSGTTAKNPPAPQAGATASPGQPAAGENPAPARGAAARKTSAAQPKRTARQAHLTVARVEPWSVMKFSFVVSLVAFVILFVAVSVLYGALSALGVFDSLQRVVSDVTSSQGSAGVNAKAWFSASRVLGYTALLGSLNIVLITAMSTIGAVVYNLTSRLVGGVEVTLKETE
jgi:Transmembrane domain of unknown function (DUF3566)